MDRERKHFDFILDALQQRLNVLKGLISEMIVILETGYETINWPWFLDNFALISSQLTSISKTLSKDLWPPVHNRTVLPLMVSPDYDETLYSLTQGRVPIFSHFVLPDYLRTKPHPIAEEKIMQNEQAAAKLTDEEAEEEVTLFYKAVSSVFEMVSNARENWECGSSKESESQKMYNDIIDTYELVSAVGQGRGLEKSKLVHKMPAPLPTVSEQTDRVNLPKVNIKTKIWPAPR